MDHAVGAGREGLGELSENFTARRELPLYEDAESKSGWRSGVEWRLLWIENTANQLKPTAAEQQLAYQPWSVSTRPCRLHGQGESPEQYRRQLTPCVRGSPGRGSYSDRPAGVLPEFGGQGHAIFDVFGPPSVDVHEQAVERSADQGGVGTVRERAWVGGVSCCTARSGWRRPSRTGSFTRTWAAATPPGPSDLGGGDPARTVDPAEVLAGFLRALGSGAVRAPVVLPELAATFRTLLAGRRVLDVLDDAAGERQVRPLLPGTGHGSAVLIGSRTALPVLEETGLLRLDVFSAPAPVNSSRGSPARTGWRRNRMPRPTSSGCAEVCRSPYGPRRPASAPGIAGRCACWPTGCATRPPGSTNWSAPTSTYAPGSTELPLAAGAAAPDLPAARHAGVRRLRPLGGRSAGWGEPARRGTPRGRLADAHLLESLGVDSTGQTRYRFHDLVRLYARERAEREETREDRLGALSRLLRTWTALTCRAGSTVRLVPRGTGDASEAGLVTRLLRVLHAWLQAEHDSLRAVVTLADRLGLDRQADILALAHVQTLARTSGAGRHAGAAAGETPPPVVGGGRARRLALTGCTRARRPARLMTTRCARCCAESTSAAAGRSRGRPAHADGRPRPRSAERARPRARSAGSRTTSPATTWRHYNYQLRADAAAGNASVPAGQLVRAAGNLGLSTRRHARRAVPAAPFGGSGAGIAAEEGATDHLSVPCSSVLVVRRSLRAFRNGTGAHRLTAAHSSASAGAGTCRWRRLVAGGRRVVCPE